MIIATQKPFHELIKHLRTMQKVLVVGCHTCVTIGHIGGVENIDVVLSALELGMNHSGREIEFQKVRIPRQCETAMLESEPILQRENCNFDCILSFGCAAGVQAVADLCVDKPVIPALNTRFMGSPNDNGWEIRCIGCGDCFLHMTGGVCVLARCPRKMQNSSCGFESESGRCDVYPQQECVWDIIRARFNAQNTLKLKADTTEPVDYIPSRFWNFAAGDGCVRVPGINQNHSESKGSVDDSS